MSLRDMVNSVPQQDSVDTEPEDLEEYEPPKKKSKTLIPGGPCEFCRAEVSAKWRREKTCNKCYMKNLRKKHRK